MSVKRVLTVLKQPSLGWEYAAWRASAAFSRDGPTRVLAPGVVVGSFANFSEYHSVGGFVSAAEMSFWTTYPFEPGELVDVGANLGVVSLMLAHRYPERTVHAFEPNPSTFAALQSNIARNEVRNARTHQVALSDTDGTAYFDADPRARATASLAPSDAPHAIPVECRRLDRLVADGTIGPIAVLKVDVEGFEAALFKGARSTLQRQAARLIYFEIVPSLAAARGFAPTEAARILLECGYRLHRLDANGHLQPASLDEIDRITIANWIAIPAPGRAA